MREKQPSLFTPHLATPQWATPSHSHDSTTPNPCHYFPVLQGPGQVNDNKCTNTHEPWRQKYPTDTLTTLSGIADTAGETEDRLKASHYISADLKCMRPTILQGPDGPTNLPSLGSSQLSPRAHVPLSEH